MNLTTELIEHYLDEHGGYLLKGGEPNDNPVLFLVQSLQEIYLSGDSIWPAEIYFKRFMAATSVNVSTDGLPTCDFHRHPRLPKMINSHDNYVGIAAGYALFGEYKKLSLILMALSARGWNFNNVQPFKWDIRGQLKPNDICFMKLCAKWEPTLWESLHFGLHVAFFGSWNLNRLRLVAISNVEMSNTPANVFIKVCAWWAKKRTDWVAAITDYFGPGQPVTTGIRKSDGAWTPPEVSI